MKFSDINFSRFEPAVSALERLRSYFSEKDAGYYIKTFGCQMNVRDSENLAGMLENMGLVRRKSAREADVVLVNTCCVREHAEVKVYGNVGSYCKMKREGKNMLIGVCGCMMQQKHMADEMRRRFPGVDFYMGTNMLHELPEIMLEALESGRRQERIKGPTGPVVEGLPASGRRGPSAFVNIMYGCDNFCSYCVVPLVRGRERSRAPGAILDEIASLADQGCVEITLLGQNVNSYGKGLPDKISFAGLLRQVDRIPGIRRIRFMTSHPKDLSEELMDAMAGCEHVCAHLHLPVQSGSNAVLAAMNRGYTREHYLELVTRLRQKMPQIDLTTDIIVGFPGESDTDYEDTKSLLQQVRYDSAFLFRYSVRRGTAAEKMAETVPEESKTQRLYALIAEQEAITAQRGACHVGKNEEVLVESVSARDPGEVSGRANGSWTVNLRGDKGLIGRIVPVRIIEAKAHTLYGEIVQ
ncbi:MAG: tRNA (N6-isopentenyl adenosine(37)-C2)-methylthiotransferase MiaB [Clostridiales bacterium]|nr:tRNA (N6-isopentenyl adenosine(37)-C2)-methylthiotransferase MiaB [Clostridiales bacterium]